MVCNATTTFTITHVAAAGSVEDVVEGDGGDGVDDEPPLHVIDGYLLRVYDHLPVVNVSRPATGRSAN